MATFEDELVFEVDFNDRDERGRLVASLSFALSMRKPERGETIMVRDDEGNRCLGTVADVKNTIVFVDLDRSTWSRLTVLEPPVSESLGSVRTSVSHEPDTKGRFELVA